MLNLGGLIKSALTNPANVEVDPARLQPTDNAAQNMQALRTECTKFFNAIMGSFKSAPTLMRQAVSALSESVSWKFPDQRLQSIGGFLFLRYFCPSMSTPEAYGLCDRTWRLFLASPIQLTHLYQLLTLPPLLRDATYFSLRRYSKPSPMECGLYRRRSHT
jgi:hypothetical protein